MIWLFLSLFVVVAVVFIGHPLMRPRPVTTSGDISRLKAEIDALDVLYPEDADAETKALKRDDLERRLLAELDAADQAQATPMVLKRWIGLGLPVLVGGGALGLYLLLGSPGFVPERQAPPPSQQLDQATVERAVTRLTAAVEAGEATVVEHRLLARTLMAMERYAEGVAAYRTLAERTDATDEIRDEAAQAERFLAGLRAAETMTQDEQDQMIRSMVEGLAARLTDDPDDLEGWMRLIQARLVLGDRDQAEADLAAAKAAFVGNDAALEALQTVEDRMSIPAP